jgi:hypothetical protein
VASHASTTFAGAFVSNWIIRKNDLTVLHGGDQAKQVLGGASQAALSLPLERWGSYVRLIWLPSAFYTSKSAKGIAASSS